MTATAAQDSNGFELVVRFLCKPVTLAQSAAWVALEIDWKVKAGKTTQKWQRSLDSKTGASGRDWTEFPIQRDLGLAFLLRFQANLNATSLMGCETKFFLHAASGRVSLRAACWLSLYFQKSSRRRLL